MKFAGWDKLKISQSTQRTWEDKISLATPCICSGTQDGKDVKLSEALSVCRLNLNYQIQSTVFARLETSTFAAMTSTLNIHSKNSWTPVQYVLLIILQDEIDQDTFFHIDPTLEIRPPPKECMDTGLSIICLHHLVNIRCVTCSKVCWTRTYHLMSCEWRRQTGRCLGYPESAWGEGPGRYTTQPFRPENPRYPSVEHSTGCTESTQPKSVSCARFEVVRKQASYPRVGWLAIGS